jgi:hypothetical protein
MFFITVLQVFALAREAFPAKRTGNIMMGKFGVNHIFTVMFCAMSNFIKLRADRKGLAHRILAGDGRRLDPDPELLLGGSSIKTENKDCDRSRE